MLKSSSQKALAKRFLEFMMSPGFQELIPTTNWMYPANLPREALPPEFERLIDLQEALRNDLLSAAGRALRGQAPQRSGRDALRFSGA